MYGAHRLRSMFSRKFPENELGNNKLARLRRPRKMAILTSIRSSIKVLQSSSSLKFRNIFKYSAEEYLSKEFRNNAMAIMIIRNSHGNFSKYGSAPNKTKIYCKF
jgi:hypothetical protein